MNESDKRIANGLPLAKDVLYYITAVPFPPSLEGLAEFIGNRISPCSASEATDQKGE